MLEGKGTTGTTKARPRVDRIRIVAGFANGDTRDLQLFMLRPVQLQLERGIHDVRLRDRVLAAFRNLLPGFLEEESGARHGAARRRTVGRGAHQRKRRTRDERQQRGLLQCRVKEFL